MAPAPQPFELAPRREQTAEAQKFADLQIGSALLVSLRVQGKPTAILGLAHTMPSAATFT